MTATAALSHGGGSVNENFLGELRSTQSLRYNQLEHQEQIRYHHNTLTRTASQPQSHHQYSNNQQQHRRQQQQTVPTVSSKDGSTKLTSLVNTLIENLDNMKLHRKLERTQSEPLPQLQLQQQLQVNTSRYKTELCRPFEEAGECKYGEKCQFAHGYHELRNLQRHPKYKTEYCRTFHSVGFCPYGPRCHFVHNADEARAMQQQQMLQHHSKNVISGGNHNGTFNSSNFNSQNTFNNCISTFEMIQGSPHKNNNNGSDSGGKYNLPLSPPLSMSTGSDRESPTGSLSLSPTNSMTNFHFGDISVTAQPHQKTSSTSSGSFQLVPTTVPYTIPSEQTPPDSPSAPISPVNTPPAATLFTQSLHQSLRRAIPTNIVIPDKVKAASTGSRIFSSSTCKPILTKSSSSPPDTTQARNDLDKIERINGAECANVKMPIKVNTVSSLNDISCPLRVGGGDGVSGAEDTRLPVFNQLSGATLDNFTAN